jgi:hypothetical protein
MSGKARQMAIHEVERQKKMVSDPIYYFEPGTFDSNSV